MRRQSSRRRSRYEASVHTLASTRWAVRVRGPYAYAVMPLRPYRGERRRDLPEAAQGCGRPPHPASAAQARDRRAHASRASHATTQRTRPARDTLGHTLDTRFATEVVDKLADPREADPSFGETSSSRGRRAARTSSRSTCSGGGLPRYIDGDLAARLRLRVRASPRGERRRDPRAAAPGGPADLPAPALGAQREHRRGRHA